MNRKNRRDMCVLRKLARQNPIHAVSYYKAMGTNAIEHGMNEEAEKYFMKSLELGEELIRKKIMGPNRDLVFCCNRLAIMADREFRYSDAIEYLKKMENYCTILTETNGTIQSFTDLQACCYSMTRQNGGSTSLPPQGKGC